MVFSLIVHVADVVITGIYSNEKPVTFSIQFFTYILITMQATQQTQPQNVVVIDSKTPVTREDLLDFIAELKGIIKEALEAIS